MNRDSYNAIAQEWDSARQVIGTLEAKYLAVLLQDLPSDAAVLDLGCGSGHPLGTAIVSRGHQLTGVDQAANLLALARRRLPQSRWIESRIEDYCPEPAVAAILCWDVLFHIPRERHEALVKRWFEALHNDGRLMLSFGGSEHPAFVDEMFGKPFFYDSWAPEPMQALLSKTGFTILMGEYTSVPDGGRDKGRYVVVSVKSPAASGDARTPG
ncbi:MAG: class I SAM-dependent methyltransferase [Ahniella sp.]|nr:class I SAM-dependent methyltransferase [Ahniella sp.]